MDVRFSSGRIDWLVAILTLFTVPLAAQQDGSRRWALNISGYITYSSPALSADGSIVYVGTYTTTRTGRVVAASTAGDPIWNISLPSPVDSSPAVGPDGTVYVGCVNGKLYALNGLTGGEKWSVLVGGYVTSSPAVGADGTIYVGCYVSSTAGAVAAFDPTGATRWTFATRGPVESSPAIGADGTIYIGCADRYLYALSGADGTEIWRYQTGGAIFASPAIGADGTIYIGSSDQGLYAITRSGTLKWVYGAGGRIDSSPVLGMDGTIYFGADVHLYALNPEGTNEEREKWKTRLGTTLGSTPAVRADGTIIVGADDGRVYARKSDGSSLWTFNTRLVQEDDDFVESSAMVAADGSIYIGSSSGRLFCLYGNGSPLSTYSTWPSFRGTTTHTGRSRTVTGAGRLVNLSTRASATGSKPVIAGFVLGGLDYSVVMVRGVGPTLAQFGVSSYMRDPRLDLYASGVPYRTNDDWEGQTSGVNDIAAARGAFPLPAGSKDAALVDALLPGVTYSSVVSSVDGQGGVVLTEVYDASEEPVRLQNVSVRNDVGTGENVLLLGFVVGGTLPSRVLVRAIGPGLRPFGVANFIARPSLSIRRSGSDTAFATNTGWSSLVRDIEVAGSRVGAFALESGSADCALVLTLDPGAYTVQVSGVNNTTGEALAEVYLLP